MCCGVVPILFGWFLRVPSLHSLVFISENFFVTCKYILPHRILIIEVCGLEAKQEMQIHLVLPQPVN